MSKQAVPLNTLDVGQRARVVQLSVRGAAKQRFSEMGLVKGEQIEVTRVAPLGDPVEYLVKGYRLSLRKRDAGQVLVEVQDA